MPPETDECSKGQLSRHGTDSCMPEFSACDVYPHLLCMCDVVSLHSMPSSRDMPFLTVQKQWLQHIQRGISIAGKSEFEAG